MGSDYRQYTALVAAVTLTEPLRNKWSGISLTNTLEMHAKCLIWKIGLRMRRWPEGRNLASQKFRLTLDTDQDIRGALSIFRGFILFG